MIQQIPVAWRALAASLLGVEADCSELPTILRSEFPTILHVDFYIEIRILSWGFLRG